jgi:hypothetical protein
MTLPVEKVLRKLRKKRNTGNKERGPRTIMEGAQYRKRKWRE